MDLAVIFDLDGTVINTDSLIFETFRFVFNKYLPGHDLTQEELHSFLGPSLRTSFGRYFERGVVEECVRDYRKYNHEIHEKYVTIYPGVEKTLAKLKEKGYRLAIVTTKFQESAYLGLDMFNLRHYFDLVIGADQVSKSKPDPEGINYVLNRLKTRKGIYIGDNDTDIMAAKNANIASVGVKWSPKGFDHIIKAGADYLVDSFEQIESIIIGESSRS